MRKRAHGPTHNQQQKIQRCPYMMHVHHGSDGWSVSLVCVRAHVCMYVHMCAHMYWICTFVCAGRYGSEDAWREHKLLKKHGGSRAQRHEAKIRKFGSEEAWRQHDQEKQRNKARCTLD